MGIVEQDRQRYRKVFGERDKQRVHWVYQVCGLCYAECAIRVKVVDGKPVAVEGVPESAKGAKGGICARGVTGLMDYYNPDRILYPVRRTNPKKGLHEDPKWQRISWEEALDIVAGKMAEARKKNPNTFLLTHTPGPTGSSRCSGAIHMFQAAHGTDSWVSGGPGVLCGASTHHITGWMHLAWDAIPDYRFCNYVLRCGGSEGAGGGRQMAATIQMAAEARERGMRMTVIDPQGFTVAAKGEEWIPILPGTDSAVLLAIANLMVNEIGVYDKEFIRHKTNACYLVGPDRLFVRDRQTGKPLVLDEADEKVKTYDDATLRQPAIEGCCTAEGVECRPGFALIKDHLKQYRPEAAAEVSTVPAETIGRLARELVEEARIGSFTEIGGVKIPYRPACVAGYRGIQTHQNAFHQYASVELINILLGNLDVCGGILGSGGIRSFGYPETGGFKFTPFAGPDGMLMHTHWVAGKGPWEVHQVGPGKAIHFRDIFVHSMANVYPYGEDWEELWNRAGRPFEPEVFFAYGGNPVMNMADPEAVGKFLGRVPFAFAFQPFHNETTEGFCDIVLPETHYLETLDASAAFMVQIAFPIGLNKWSVHIRMPVAEPMGETRDVWNLVFDLSDRLGIRPKLNETLSAFFSLRNRMLGKEAVARIIGPEETVSEIELADRAMKHHFGEGMGLEWFRDHGFITWEKKPEEGYWRWFVDARAPFYFERLEREREEIRARGEEMGFRLPWDHYTALVSYFPSVIYTEVPPESEYDLFMISYRDPLMSHRFTAGNPYIDEVARENPFSYNVAMNSETARQKGIRDGDRIYLENRWGKRLTGRVKVTELIHPRVVAAVGLGSWAKGRPISRGKGVNPNALIKADQYHMCPITGSVEPTVRVRAYAAQ